MSVRISLGMNFQNGEAMKGPKWLLQSFILSITLNVVLVAIFFYFIVRDNPLQFSYRPVVDEENEAPGCSFSSLKKLGALDFPSLMILLKDQRPVHGGYAVRDFALGALVSFHHFDLKRALPGRALQTKRWASEGKIFFIFPGLKEEDYYLILRFAKEEKWPFSAEGLFQEISSKGIENCDAQLLSQFCHTPEFISLETLFARSSVPIKRKTLLLLALEGGWERLQLYHQGQEKLGDFSDTRRQCLLLDYVEADSVTAAELINLLESANFQEVTTKFFDRPSIGELRPRFREPIPASPDPRCHIIQMGESLWTIAQKYRVTVEEIMEINHMQSTLVRAGRTLKIP